MISGVTGPKFVKFLQDLPAVDLAIGVPIFQSVLECQCAEWR